MSQPFSVVIFIEQKYRNKIVWRVTFSKSPSISGGTFQKFGKLNSLKTGGVFWCFKKASHRREGMSWASR